MRELRVVAWMATGFTLAAVASITSREWSDLAALACILAECAIAWGAIQEFDP